MNAEIIKLLLLFVIYNTITDYLILYTFATFKPCGRHNLLNFFKYGYFLNKFIGFSTLVLPSEFAYITEALIQLLAHKMKRARFFLRHKSCNLISGFQQVF